MAKPGSGSGDRSGHHLEPRHRVRRRPGRPRARAARVRPALSRPPAGSSTIPRTSGARPSRPRARRWPPPGWRPRDIAAIGITNQRETCVHLGPAHRPADPPRHRLAGPAHGRRVPRRCKAAGHEPAVTAKTGLLLDPYFSATKIAWLLDHVEGARALGRGRPPGLRHHRHASCSGASPAARCTPPTPPTPRARCSTTSPRAPSTTICWRCSTCRARMLPEVRDCDADFGDDRAVDPRRRACPILGVAGDQQAATIGQACFAPGMVKATYGTGCFALLNTGERAGRLAATGC